MDFFLCLKARESVQRNGAAVPENLPPLHFGNGAREQESNAEIARWAAPARNRRRQGWPFIDSSANNLQVPSAAA
jgi:hypothetical protein